MKKTAMFVLLLSLLASCGTAPGGFGAATAQPTRTPAPAATASPTPTETPDPFKGAPQGTTGKDSKTGRWIKTAEDGTTLYYMPELATLPESERWAERMTPEGIMIIDAPYGDLEKAAHMHIFRSGSDQLGGVTQVITTEGYLESRTVIINGNPARLTPSQYFLGNLLEVNYSTPGEEYQYDISYYQDCSETYNTRRYSLKLPDQSGVVTEQQWILGNDINVIHVGWDSADPAKAPTFTGNSKKIRWKYVIQDNTLNIVMALNPETPISEKEYLYYIIQLMTQAIRVRELPAVGLIGIDKNELKAEKIALGLGSDYDFYYELWDELWGNAIVLSTLDYSPEHNNGNGPEDPHLLEFVR